MNERIWTSWSIRRRLQSFARVPPLFRVGTPTYMAGLIHNSPEDMAFWIEGPQQDYLATLNIASPASPRHSPDGHLERHRGALATVTWPRARLGSLLPRRAAYP